VKSAPTAKPHARSVRRRSGTNRTRPVRKTKWTLWLALLLAAVTIAVYSPVHSHPFAELDDGAYFYANPHVRVGLTWDTVKWAFTSFGSTTPDVPDWHPLAWLAHALDSEMFGPGPAGPHDINLLLHVLNAVLMFWILQRATGYVERSAMVAALFALHPINVESVAWIAERKNLLSMTLFLLTLMAYGWYARKPRARRYSVVVGLFALALMAKPQVVTLPFVLLLWDYWPLERIAFRSADRSWLFAFRQSFLPSHSGEERSAKREDQSKYRPFRRLLLEKLPLFALAAVSCIITVKSQLAVGGINQHFALSARLENAIVCYARYLGKAIWPANLAPFYPHPGASLPASQVGAALFVLIAVSAIAVALRRQPYFFVGWFWFLGTLVPMIGLLQVNRQAMADRYAYLPFVGLFILACWGVSDLAAQRHLSPMVLRAVAVAVLAGFTALTCRQIGYWGDNLVLWNHALAVTQNNYLAENIVGSTLMDQGHADEALPHFVAATRMDPADPSAYMAIGTYEQQHGNAREAIDDYQKTIMLTDQAVGKNLWLRSTTFARMGSAYRQLGQFELARASFQNALEINPQDAQVWLALGIVTAQAGDSRAAAQAYLKALKIQPSDVGFLLLARALDQTGQSGQAESARAEAQRLSRNLAAAQRTVEAVFAGPAASSRP
jgi:protein O-mannosyl-transferase